MFVGNNIYRMKRIKQFTDFLVEKKIGQVTTKIEIKFLFEVIKTKHADDRSDFEKRGLEGENQSRISNLEMTEFVRFFKEDLAAAISDGRIEDQTQFVLKSKERDMSMAVVAQKVTPLYWKMIVKTVFRESDKNKLRVGRGQLVFKK